MKTETYFVIHNGEGDTSVEMVEKQTLIKRLNEEYYGSDPVFLEKMPDNTNTNYWTSKYLIIKGEIVVPKEVKSIIEYTL